MSIRKCVPAALFAALAMSAAGRAQTSQPATAPSAAQATPAAASTIPPDQQATKEQMAKLFEVMRVREQMQSYMRMMPNLFRQQLQAQMKDMMAKMPENARPTAEAEGKIEALINTYMTKAMSAFSVDDMIADMATVYQHHIDRADTDALIAFYSSPAGQHFLEEQPAIMQEYMPMVMNRSRKITQELTDQMMKDVQNMAKTAPAQAPASTPATK